MGTFLVFVNDLPDGITFKIYKFLADDLHCSQKFMI